MPQKLTLTSLERMGKDIPFRVGSPLAGEAAKKGTLRWGFRRLATRVFSSGMIRCPTCGQRNPADSRYCGACGGTLHLPPHLASCPRCGVVGQVTATVCFWCHGPLPGRRADARVRSPLIARASGLLRRRRSLATVGAAALAAMVIVVGYATTRERSPTEAPQPPGASGETSDRGAPVETPSPGEAPATKTVAPPVARPQAINTGRAGERKPLEPEACTEAVAALGLCAGKGEAATARPAIEHPRTTDIGKAGGQEPAEARACTEAAAALGLCTPKPVQRRE